MYNVPVELWTAAGLSYLASAVGEPLYADSLTESKRRLNLARICVLIDAAKPLVKAFGVNTSAKGKEDIAGITMIRVTFQWSPPRCEDCKTFRHNSDCCPALTKGVQSSAKNQRGSQVEGQDKVWRVVGLRDNSKAVVEGKSGECLPEDLQPKEVAEAQSDKGKEAESEDASRSGNLEDLLVDEEDLTHSDREKVIAQLNQLSKHSTRGEPVLDLVVDLRTETEEVPVAPERIPTQDQQASGDMRKIQSKGTEMEEDRETAVEGPIEEDYLASGQRSTRQKKDRRKNGLLAGPVKGGS